MMELSRQKRKWLSEVEIENNLGFQGLCSALDQY
jgi:hypothetical protein